MQGESARLTSARVHPPKEYPCPSCLTARRLRGAHSFANVACGQCGAEWRPRGEIGGYRLHELLARGGFSLIFRASDLESGAVVAVKMFALTAGITPEDAERFIADLQIVAGYEHPHWLRIFGGGMEEDFAWLAMEWLPEGSLARRGRMDEMEALRAAAQIADALASAHACGLRHRNLQLGECLLADAHTMKVSGFAEAVFYERAGEDLGAVWGRLSCAPPERIFEQPEDARSEIYALGAIAFQMLAGELPYEGETMPELLLERFDGPPLRLEDCAPGLRKTTAEIVDRMLAIEPRRRISTWDETADLLQKQLGGGAPASVKARATSVPVARPIAKAPVYSAARGAWLTILMLAGIAGVAGWFGWKHFHEPPLEKVATSPVPTAISTPAPEPIAAPPATPAPDVEPIAKTEIPEAPPPLPQKPAPPKFDWSGWKKFALESPKRPGVVKGDHHLIPGSGALRLTGNNSGMAGGSDENIFYARQIEDDWTLTVRVSANGGAAGIAARENIGSDRPCVGIFLGADGKLNSALRASPAAALVPQPVTGGAGARWLRIARRGAAMSAFHSADGKQWRETATLNLPSLPATVPVGFVVWSGVKEKMTGATFEDVALSVGK